MITLKKKTAPDRSISILHSEYVVWSFCVDYANGLRWWLPGDNFIHFPDGRMFADYDKIYMN